MKDSENMRIAIAKALSEGMAPKDVCKVVGCHLSTVYRIRKEITQGIYRYSIDHASCPHVPELIDGPAGGPDDVRTGEKGERTGEVVSADAQKLVAQHVRLVARLRRQVDKLAREVEAAAGSRSSPAAAVSALVQAAERLVKLERQLAGLPPLEASERREGPQAAPLVVLPVKVDGSRFADLVSDARDGRRAEVDAKGRVRTIGGGSQGD